MLLQLTCYALVFYLALAFLAWLDRRSEPAE